MANKVTLVNPQSNQTFAESFVIFLVTLNTIASLSNICVNSTLIYIICKLRLLKKISYRLILSLSVSDLCVGIIVQPMLSARFLISDPRILLLLRLVLQFFGIMFVQTSAIMTAVISLDRYLHMKHLMYYNSHMTKKRANSLIVFTVLVSFLISVAITVGTIYELTIYFNTFWLSLNVVIMFFIVVFYSRAYLSIKSRVGDTTFQSANSRRIQRPDLEFIKGMVFILVALFVFYVPYEIIGMLIFFTPNTASMETKLNLQYAFYVCIIFVYLVSVYNGIILITFDRKLKTFFKRNILRRHQSSKSISVVRDTTICLEDVP